MFSKLNTENETLFVIILKKKIILVYQVKLKPSSRIMRAKI